MVKKIALGMLLSGMTSVTWAASPIVTDVCNDAKEWNLKKVDKSPACRAVYAAESRTVTAPEIDPSSAIAGFTLLLGGVAVIRGRRMTTSNDCSRS